MDDFLGTSIQYSELQIKLLEKEHYENQQKIVEELISSGFLDSDYEEESTETEFESTDNELSEASLEIKENNLNESESPSSFELIELEKEEEELSSPSSSLSSDNSSSNLNMVLSSDISVVDEFNVSNSESINDATINQIIDNIDNRDNIDNINIDNEYKQQYENEYNSDDQIQEIQQFDMVTSKAIIRFMGFVFSDIKYLMILFVLMVAYPHIIDRLHHENDNDIPQFYGGGVHSGYRGHNGCYHQRTIHWNVEPYYAATTHSIINDEDDERDEYQNDDDNIHQQEQQEQQDQDQNEDQCIKKQHILSFDIMTTTFDMNKKLRRAHLEHHEIKIAPSDLCNNNGANSNNNDNLRMRIRNMQIPREVPRLFMNIGGLSSVRGFKSTSIASVGRHFGQSRGLYALVMAFVGIAGFAASNNIDEIMSITISS